MNVDMPQSTQSFALGLVADRKAKSDQTAVNAINNIMSGLLMEMFSAGYHRAMVDNNLIETPTEGEAG